MSNRRKIMDMVHWREKHWDPRKAMELINNSGGEAIHTEYKDVIMVRCECGYESSCTWFEYWIGFGQKCKWCRQSRKWNIDKVRNFVETYTYCELLSKTYKTSTNELKFKCECGEVFSTRWGEFVRGVVLCRSCRNKPKTNWDIKSVDMYVKENSRCELISSKYDTCDKELDFRCKCGSIFSATFMYFQNMKNKSCELCRGKWNIEIIKAYTVKHGMCELLSNTYKSSGEDLSFRCNCGSEFIASWSQVLQTQKHQCNQCNLKVSRGEMAIKRHLDDRDIPNILEYSFEDCRHKRKLRFDVAILDDKNKLKMLIEYDGRQHYEPVDFFGGDKAFEGVVKRDQIKNQYCKDNDIPLLRIPYWEFDNIETILDTYS